MKGEFERAEEEILMGLWPDKRRNRRSFLSKEPDYKGINDKPLSRCLKRLVRDGYVIEYRRPDWRRGMSIHYSLSPKGKSVARQLMVGDVGRILFIQILKEVEAITILPDDEGEWALEPALRIVNMLWDKEKSARLRETILELLGESNYRTLYAGRRS